MKESPQSSKPIAIKETLQSRKQCNEENPLVAMKETPQQRKPTPNEGNSAIEETMQ